MIMIKDLIIQKIINIFSTVNNIKNSYDISDNNFALILELTDIKDLIPLLNYLKNEPEIYCEQLIDICAVDYLHYGVTEIDEDQVNKSGFNRAINDEYIIYTEDQFAMYKNCRFAIVYQLLSITNNLRIMLKCLLNDLMNIPSCIDIWPVANWYEREIFDMFGIKFIGHPNLRRILTEDDFNGYPLRKDFPLTGTLEMRFDAQRQKVVRQAIDIEHYLVAPKVIRNMQHND